MKIFVNIKNSVSNWVLNNANEKLKYTVITFCYISCFSHSLDGRSYSVMTVYLTIFFFFFICSCSQVYRKDSDSFTQKNIFTSLPFLLQRNCLRCLEGFFVASKEIFYHHSLFPNCSFSQISRRNVLILQYLFFWLGICRTSWKDFINLPIFCYFACFSEFWQSTYYIPKCHIFTFRIVSSKSNIYRVTFSFYSICLRYLGRTMLLHLNNIFLCYNLIN